MMRGFISRFATQCPQCGKRGYAATHTQPEEPPDCDCLESRECQVCGDSHTTFDRNDREGNPFTDLVCDNCRAEADSYEAEGENDE